MAALPEPDLSVPEVTDDHRKRELQPVPPGRTPRQGWRTVLVRVFSYQLSRERLLDAPFRVLAALITALNVTVSVVTALALIVILAVMMTLLSTVVGVANHFGVPISAPIDLRPFTDSIQRPVQEFIDRFDPAHPPRYALPQDQELAQLQWMSPGTKLFQTGKYSLTLQEIKKRDGAKDRDEAQYAVVHRKLVIPDVTIVGGITIREDWREEDYYLYKGEAFLLGSLYFKVNSVSLERQRLAIATHRKQDEALPSKLKIWTEGDEISGPAVPPLGDAKAPPNPKPQQDTEFDQLRTVTLGGVVGRTADYVFTLKEVKKRDGAKSRDEAQYAVVHKKLQSPRPRTIGPFALGEEADEADYYLYKGESFQLDTAYYKVNWISAEGQLTVGLYRDPDDLTDRLKFSITPTAPSELP